jgi:3-oxoadipate enol-lactonase
MKKIDDNAGVRTQQLFTRSSSTLGKRRTTVAEMSTPRTSRRDHPSSDEAKSGLPKTVAAESVGARTKRRAADAIEKAVAATTELTEPNPRPSSKPRRVKGAQSTGSIKTGQSASTPSKDASSTGKESADANAVIDDLLHELGTNEAPWLPTDTTIQLNAGGSLVVHDIPGPANAPVVFLQHGWTVTANLNFFRIYRQLAKKYRVIAFDIRGHGQGVRPRAFFRLEDCADDCVAVADALGIDRFVVVGYSMGGTIAQLAAHRHPTRVQGVVLCATSKRFRSQGKDRMLWEGSMGLTAAVLTLAPQPVRQQLLSRFLLVRKDEMPGWMLDEVRRNDAALVAQAGLALGRYDATSWIGELGREGATGVPASVVITTKDKTVPTVRQRKLASTLSGATFHEVEADHRAAVTDPELFLPALLAALRDVTT